MTTLLSFAKLTPILNCTNILFYITFHPLNLNLYSLYSAGPHRYLYPEISLKSAKLLIDFKDSDNKFSLTHTHFPVSASLKVT